MNRLTAELLRAAAVIAILLLLTFIGPLLDGDLDPAPTEAEVAEAVAADLADAIAQAQAERPDLWDAETKARAHAAVALVARRSAEQ